MRLNKSLLLLAAILLVPGFVICQRSGPDATPPSDTINVRADAALPPDTSSFRQQDIKDWLVGKGWMKKKPEKNKFFLVIPVVAANPTAGFIFGGGFTLAYKTAPTDTRLSTASSNATYSSNHLLNLNVKTNAFVLNERMVLNGDWRYLINSETTYGLGTKSKFSGQTGLNGYNISNDSLGDPLQFRHIRVDEIASWQLFRNFFAGAGFQFDHRYDITDEEWSAGDTALAYHYRYSKEHGFDSSKYTTSGFCLNLLFDSRDNGINAYSGFYGNVNYQINSTSFGSSKNSTLLLLEYRSFHSLDGEKRRNILSFWLYGNFVTSGEVPYLALPALGYDQRQRTGRGYSFGRFRGEDLLYGESEYRFPISSHTGILGGVVFVNCTSTTNRMLNISLLNYLQVSSGTGLRIMLDKKSRTRLEVDAAIAHRSVGFYFGAQETF